MMIDLQWTSDLILSAFLGTLFGVFVLVLIFLNRRRLRLKEQNRELKGQLRELTLLSEHKERFYLEKIEALNLAQSNMSESFKALSSDALRANNEVFLQLASSKLDHLHHGMKTDMEARHLSIDQALKPLKESLEKVDKNHQDLRSTLAVTHTSFQEQVKSLVTAQNQLQGETTNLVKALRTPAVKGRWGEMQLRRTVEITGMMEHCDFNEQPLGSSGSRPDMIVHLPGNKKVIVDSKTPLQSYLDALDTEDEVKRKKLLGEHARHVRMHITQLASKSYWEQFKEVPEFVILFLPGEIFFSAALQEDPQLIEFGIEQKVLLATPTTLIAMLRTIAFGWRQEQLSENAEKISELGREFYERLESFTQHFQELRRSIEKSVESYNGALGCFKNRVCVTARKLQEVGAGNDKEIREIEPIEKRLKVVDDKK